MTSRKKIILVVGIGAVGTTLYFLTKKPKTAKTVESNSDNSTQNAGQGKPVPKHSRIFSWTPPRILASGVQVKKGKEIADFWTQGQSISNPAQFHYSPSFTISIEQAVAWLLRIRYENFQQKLCPYFGTCKEKDYATAYLTDYAKIFHSLDKTKIRKIYDKLYGGPGTLEQHLQEVQNTYHQHTGTYFNLASHPQANTSLVSSTLTTKYQQGAKEVILGIGLIQSFQVTGKGLLGKKDLGQFLTRLKTQNF